MNLRDLLEGNLPDVELDLPPIARPSRRPWHHRPRGGLPAMIQPRCYCTSCLAARPESRAFLVHERRALDDATRAAAFRAWRARHPRKKGGAH